MYLDEMEQSSSKSSEIALLRCPMWFLDSWRSNKMIIFVTGVRNRTSCSTTCAWRHTLGGAGVGQLSNQMLLSFRPHWKWTDSFLAMRKNRVWDRREAEREKEGIVSGSADALWDFASVLCAAIVHQSLLEAKSVRTEQRFLRDLSLSAGMLQRKLKPGTGSDGWAQTLFHYCTFSMP